MRWIQMLGPALLLAGCAGEAPAPPARVVEARTFAADAPRGAGRLRQAMEAVHRSVRATVGVPRLAWDAALAADAQRYADTLAATGRFVHSPTPRGVAEQGENLWTGTRGAYRYGEMTGHWVAERKDYVHATLPAVSRTGRFGDVGHYTQMIWRDTRRFGCAEASNAKDDFVVCRYMPVGNVVGQRAY